MTDDKVQKGRFLFFPEGSEEAYEIDMEALLEEMKEETLWQKVKNFFTGKEKKEEPTHLPVTQVESSYVNVTNLVCKMLEELLSSAKWYPKKLNTSPYPSLILEVYPKEDEHGWEPVVTIATPNGRAVDLGLSDLLFHYDPEIGGVDKEVGQLIHN